MMRALLMMAAALLGGCAAGDKQMQYVYVTPEIVRPVPPSECMATDPVFPKLPGGDVDAVAAVKDRIAIRRRDLEIARRRVVCRSWLKQQLTPAGDAGSSIKGKRAVTES